MISSSTIDTIFDAARIEEVVGDFVPLKRRGANMMGNCPFHNEKTPSFTVSPAKGIYKCFGCGASGNAVKFVMEHEHVSYPDALRYLAKKYQIEIEETILSPEVKEEMNTKEALFAVNQWAESYFVDNLWNHEKGKAIGLTYFHERGFNDEILHKFKLGYALEEWDHLLNTAKEKGYKEEFLKKLGLVTQGEKTVDMYRGRVIFPIHNVSGRVLGFGGRILKSNEKSPKYINSNENEIYIKNKNVYGIFQGKNAIAKLNKCYLVEGYTDLIALHQAGIENVVASLGTSLTEGQIELIKRYTPNITILYDGDSAGIKASFRGIDMILQQGMNVKIVLFPDGEDPDSYAKSHTYDELISYINEAETDFIRFKSTILIKESDKDPMIRANAVKEIVNSIGLIPDPLIRQIYVQECSHLLNVSEQILYNEINKIRREITRKKLKNEGWEPNEIPTSSHEEKAPNQESQELPNKEWIYEKELLRILINYPERKIKFEQKSNEGDVELIETTVAEYIVNDLQEDEIRFSNATHQMIFDESISFIKDNKIDKLFAHFTRHNDSEILNVAIDLTTEKESISDNWLLKHKINTIREDSETQMANSLFEVIYNFKVGKVQSFMDHLQDKLKTNPVDFTSILEEIKTHQEIKKSLSNILSVVIWK